MGGRGEESTEERLPAIARLGIELNRHFLRCDLAEIDRDRERPYCAVVRGSGFSDAKVPPMPPQAKLPAPHRPRQFTPIARTAANLGDARQVILLDILPYHPSPPSNRRP